MPFSVYGFFTRMLIHSLLRFLAEFCLCALVLAFFLKESYFVNYKIDEESWFEDIRFIDGKKFENKIDLFVGGSPCQSFSMMGKRAGLEDARGTLFYEYARLVNEIKPKVFIYENVPGMINHDNGNTWKVVREIFESLGYKFYFQILNSKDYGIPQKMQGNGQDYLP